MTDPSIEDLMAELEAVKGELEKYKRDLEANTFEDTGPSVTVHFFPPYGYLYGGGGGNTGDHMYVSKKDFDKCVFDLKCWHRAYNDQINSLESALAHVKAESLRVVKVGGPCKLSELEDLNIENHTNTCTVEGADWRIYATERRVDKNGHRYLMPVSDGWPPIAFGPDTMVQRVELKPWESEA